MTKPMQDGLLTFDEIGYWSEVKLDIVKKYAAAYAKILGRQKRLSFSYIDGFAGTGVHAPVPGSDQPRRPFRAARGKP